MLLVLVLCVCLRVFPPFFAAASCLFVFRGGGGGGRVTSGGGGVCVWYAQDTFNPNASSIPTHTGDGDVKAGHKNEWTDHE